MNTPPTPPDPPKPPVIKPRSMVPDDERAEAIFHSVIKAGMDTREILARFEAERQAPAMMDHPNIAKVVDAGATATGRPYFAMELASDFNGHDSRRDILQATLADTYRALGLFEKAIDIGGGFTGEAPQNPWRGGSAHT